MLCSHFTQNCIFCTFWRLKILVLWRKIVQNLLIFVYLFSPKNSTTGFTKIFITQKWLVVESCPTPRWIAFLMLYRLVHNIRSHFNELTLTWSDYHNVVCTFYRTELWLWCRELSNLFQRIQVGIEPSTLIKPRCGARCSGYCVITLERCIIRNGKILVQKVHRNVSKRNSSSVSKKVSHVIWKASHLWRQNLGGTASMVFWICSLNREWV